MWYLVYKTIVIVCKPVVRLLSLLPFEDWNEVRFYCILLYRNKWKVSAAYLAAKHETNNFMSHKYTAYKNCYGMGVFKDGSLPAKADGTVLIQFNGTSQQFCIYRTIEDSVYSFYKTAYDKIPNIGKAIDNTPQVDYETYLVYPSNFAIAYYAGFAQALKNANWYTGDVTGYTWAILSRYRGFNNSYRFFWVSIVCTIWIWWSIVVIVGYLLNKDKRKNHWAVKHINWLTGRK